MFVCVGGVVVGRWGLSEQYVTYIIIVLSWTRGQSVMKWFYDAEKGKDRRVSALVDGYLLESVGTDG